MSVCTRTTCKQRNKIVSVWESFTCEPSVAWSKVVWTCSHIYLGWWSNKPWKTLLLHYPTGISPVIHYKQRDREKWRVVEEGEEEESENGVMGGWTGRCLSSGEGEQVQTRVSCCAEQVWLIKLSFLSILPVSPLFFSFHSSSIQLCESHFKLCKKT